MATATVKVMDSDYSFEEEHGGLRRHAFMITEHHSNPRKVIMWRAGNVGPTMGIKAIEARMENGQLKEEKDLGGIWYQHDETSNSLFTTSFHINEEERRKGLGRIFIECALKDASAMGAKLLNFPGKKIEHYSEFYEPLGFEKKALSAEIGERHIGNVETVRQRLQPRKLKVIWKRPV